MKAAKRRRPLMWGQMDLEDKPFVVMWSSPWNRAYWAGTIPYKKYRDHEKLERQSAIRARRK